MIKTAMQVWDAALAMSPGYLIDRFLDWMEELSITTVPAQADRLACIEVRTEAWLDR